MLADTTSIYTNDVLSQRLCVLTAARQRNALMQGLRGIEKESLRVTHEGRLAVTPHPPSLGSALTHPTLTTDYSEALLELITPAECDPANTLEQLDKLHRFVYSVIDDEILWNNSMPGLLPSTDHDIPIARYGTSNIGRLKYVYRLGLALRYGSTMQCIAGIHYNYSLHEEVWRLLHVYHQSAATMIDYQSESYLALIRNFHRTSWLLVYLFGASAALDACFVRDSVYPLEILDADTLYCPYATSLRMGDLGYSNTKGQAALYVDYDTLQSYLKGLSQAMSQPYPPYEAIGTHRNGEWIQINTNILQIESEFYSTIRPKRVACLGERPLHALASRGVQYVEVRCMDIDPFEPIGISLETTRFLDAYLLTCALDDSPPLPLQAYTEAHHNFGRVTMEGRKPGLRLVRGDKTIAMQDWANELLAKIERTAGMLDSLLGKNEHTQAVAAQRAKLADPLLTPSARVLKTMRDRRQSFLQFSLAQSEQHAAFFRRRPLDMQIAKQFKELSRQSFDEQAKIEREEVSSSFDSFMISIANCTLNHSSA